MDGYLGWLTSGLIFLLILGAHDARAASVDADNAGCEFLSYSASVPAGRPAGQPAGRPAGQPFASNGGDHAASGFALRTSHHAALPYAGNEPRH